MIPFVIALLVAQASPLPANSPVPVGTRVQAGAPVDRAAAPADPGPGDAVIHNSGSTNTTGYTILVHPDATAELVQNGTAATKPIGKAQAASLFEKLKAAGPLDELATGRCMRSASFGTITTISYAGRTSGDIGCGGDASVVDLKTAAAAIANQVGATAFGARFRHTL